MGLRLGRGTVAAMVAVFVHGVPETPRVWDGLRQHLSRTDTLAVSLPGFATAVPDGFGSTMDEYAEWLVSELEQVVKDSGGAVDLVGHDWGGGFTLRLVSIRPDLVRSWVLDTAGLADPDFEWHDFAKIWQTPGDGEAFFEGQLAAAVPDRAAAFTMFGVPEPAALEMAAAIDQRMADSILALYRSATEVQDDWGPDFADIPKPGLVLVPSGDPFLSPTGAKRAGDRAGAEVKDLEGRGHWWMLEDPAGGAQVLESFWSPV
jgi:pimeloyl-ACP methyl ester carboxylesterase